MTHDENGSANGEENVIAVKEVWSVEAQIYTAP